MGEDPVRPGHRRGGRAPEQIKAESGARAVATAGGTTRTDDWARRRFPEQFGSPNGFHNALLCWIPTFMAETCVAGWSPFETDLGSAKVVMLWGMNPGASSLGAMRGYTDLQKAGMKIICVDPRFSETASKADLWLPSASRLRLGAGAGDAAYHHLGGPVRLRLRARLVPGLRCPEGGVRDFPRPSGRRR